MVLFLKPFTYYSWFHYGPFYSQTHLGAGEGRWQVLGLALKKKLNIKLAIYFRVIGACISSLPSNLAFPF